MILFLDDWKKYPEAIIDTTTPNVSFLRYSLLLKEMGIRNYQFPLALHNPDLQGIDPHSPSLSMEEMAMICVECLENFWYFIREVVRVPGIAGSGEGYLLANRGNISLFWLFFNHITILLIQIRQTGKSLNADILKVYLLMIRCLNTQINLITKDETLRSANLERIKDIEAALPFYLKVRTRGDLGNTEELTVKALGNTFKAHLPQRSVKMALNVGRGLTSPILFGDELTFLPNIEISLPAALAAGTAARDVARKNDEPYGTVLTTTAGKKDDRDGKYVYNRILMQSTMWTEKFMDLKNLDELEDVVRKNNIYKEPKARGVLQVACVFDHRQLGFTDEWLARALEETKAEGEAADRDFFNRWTSGTALSPLSVEQSETVRDSEQEVKYNDIAAPHGYVTRWYINEEDIKSSMEMDDFVLSVDTSDAGGGDDIGLTLRNTRTGALVAAGNYNETNLITFSEWLLNNWLLKYKRITCIIERRSTGAMILDYLILMLVAKGENPFKRLYNKVVQEKDEFPERFDEINKPYPDSEIYVKYKRCFGFATSATGATSRSDLYSTTLLNAVRYTGNRVFDRVVVNQVLSLVIRNGRVDHAEGEHDDMVISWLMSMWLLTQGKNLDYYGINSRNIMADTQLRKDETRGAYVASRAEQNNIRIEIDELIEMMRKERDEFVIQKIEHRLRYLASRLVLEENEHFSIDNLMKELNDQRRISLMASRANSGFTSISASQSYNQSPYRRY